MPPITHLPVGPSGDILRVFIIVGLVHARHVEHKVPNLAIEVALVDIPFSTITSGPVNIGIDESNAREAMFTPRIACSNTVLWAYFRTSVDNGTMYYASCADLIKYVPRGKYMTAPRVVVELHSCPQRS